jgi:hypothetical protein
MYKELLVFVGWAAALLEMVIDITDNLSSEVELWSCALQPFSVQTKVSQLVRCHVQMSFKVEHSIYFVWVRTHARTHARKSYILK